MTKILFLSGDQALIGGIEKYNHDLKESISLCDTDIRVVQRKQGGLVQKILFLLKIAGKLLINKFDYVVCGHLYFYSVPLLINLLFVYSEMTITLSAFFKAKRCKKLVILIASIP